MQAAAYINTPQIYNTMWYFLFSFEVQKQNQSVIEKCSNLMQDMKLSTTRVKLLTR
jgi:hypothetical protein